MKFGIYAIGVAARSIYGCPNTAIAAESIIKKKNVKRIFDGEKMVAIDGEYEFELGYCYRVIKNWKQWNFRKNSRKVAEIRLRTVCAAPEPDFWIIYLELSVGGKVKEQTRICSEAFDVLQRGKPRNDYPGIEFVTLESFVPAKDQPGRKDAS